MGLETVMMSASGGMTEPVPVPREANRGMVKNIMSRRVIDKSGSNSYREVMDKKRHKVHLGSFRGSFPKAACGVPYPLMRTTCFFKQVNCKRCKATCEYRANKGEEGHCV